MKLSKSEQRIIDKVVRGAVSRLSRGGVEDIEIVDVQHYRPGSRTRPHAIARELRAGGFAIVELFFRGGNLVRQNTPGHLSIPERFQCRKILDPYFNEVGIPEENIIESWNGLWCLRDTSKCQPSLKPSGFCNEMRCGG